MGSAASSQRAAGHPSENGPNHLGLQVAHNTVAPIASGCGQGSGASHRAEDMAVGDLVAQLGGYDERVPRPADRAAAGNGGSTIDPQLMRWRRAIYCGSSVTCGSRYCSCRAGCAGTCGAAHACAR